jgi:DNA repair protein RadC
MIPEIKIQVTFDKKIKMSEIKAITSSAQAVTILREMYNKDTFEWTEEMVLLCLNRSNKPIGYYKLSSGGIAGTICDPKVVFTIALKSAATGIIISHNHPSGALSPSRADKDVTEKIKKAGELLDIKLLDHVILTDEGYYSFADEEEI